VGGLWAERGGKKERGGVEEKTSRVRGNSVGENTKGKDEKMENKPKRKGELVVKSTKEAALMLSTGEKVF